MAGDLIGKKIADKITNISKNSEQNNSDTVANEPDKEILKDICLRKNDRKLLVI